MKVVKGRPLRSGRVLSVTLLLVFGASALQAQDQYSASTMWGTSATGGAGESSLSHYYNGLSAGHVNAARDGILYGDGSILSITSIGAQTVISNTVINSENIDIDIDADQSAENSGDIHTEGTFHYSPTTVTESGED